ncbi:Serine-threonine/tyrosine-protein kinase, catalytic domain [Dillenia turbinata]|uniref:non-specific serine/threonine protein kinase n=1 Tax=Dillenia turbinata TaxID=194707 RepID=A0AAN8ZRC2_9MAGN
MYSFLSVMPPCSLLYFLFIIVSTASDTLTLNGSLVDGQTLVSQGNSFELGFFSLGNPMYRYLGISYKNISVATVVWVANGDFPLLDKSGELKIGNDGNLVLLNSTRGIVWSSGLSTKVDGTVAQLLDSGNLVLMETSSADSGNYLWQSFDSQSNTAIPGTKFGLNVRTGEEWYLRSWKDWDDPSPGDFTFKLDNPELPQLIVFNHDVKKLRFGPWNGVTLIGGGIPTKKMNPILPITMVSSGDELYFLTRTTSDNIIARAFLNETGLFQEFYWDEQTNQWVEILMLDKYKCGNYGLCGFNALCTGDDSSICQCLKGFTPRAPEKWKSLDWSEGCVRVTNLTCSAEDKFLSLKQVNLPDLSHYQIGYTMPFDECQSNCQNNCSCTAFAILDIVGQESRCLHWFGALIDLKTDNEDDLVLYIKVAASELGFDSISNNKRKKWVTVGVPAAAGVTLLVLSCFPLWWKLRKNEKGWMMTTKKRAKEQGNGINLEDSECRSHEEDLDLPLVDFDTIKAITCNFADSQKIGQGGFGPVYKVTCEDSPHHSVYICTLRCLSFAMLGKAIFAALDSDGLSTMNTKTNIQNYGPVLRLHLVNCNAEKIERRSVAKLHTGQEIAVKRLSKNSRQGLTEFKNEVILIAKLQHRNLVGLLGCCIQNEEQILIYEYLPNGSLDSYVFDPERGHLLNWQKRFDIILGIARGLVYLHRDSRLRIIHRDLKASNILLDGDLNPKISDFGIAKTFQGEQAEGVTRRVIGTYGYMSPEYAIDGLFSIKSDVFSFGVLVLEITSGKRNRGFSHPHHDLSLLGHAWNLFNEGKALELLDPSIRSLPSMSEVSRCIQIGLLCVQRHAKDRPTMSSALSMLDSENALLPQPKEPDFYSERSITELSTYEVPITDGFCYLKAENVFSSLSTASDTLTLNGSLMDGQTLVSRGNSFELGFFSLGKLMQRYLGISYKNISVPTVVWVANGDFPLLDKSGLLKIGKDGNLLLDSGNLVLMESSSADSGNYQWQSLDSPSNTAIPGRKMGLNVRTGEEWYLRSWKDWDDPSPGDFTLKLYNPELPQLVLRNQDVKKLRMGPWNGVRTTSNNIIARAFLNETGLFQEFSWDEWTNQWVEIFMLDKYKCGNCGLRGFNALCTGDDSSICQCLKGFTPKVPEKWKSLDWSEDIVGQESRCLHWFGDLIDLKKDNEDDLVLYIKHHAEGFDRFSNNKGKKWVMVGVPAAAGVILLVLSCFSLRWKLRKNGKGWIMTTKKRAKEQGNGINLEDSECRSHGEDLDLPLVDFDTIKAITCDFADTQKIGQGGFGPVYKAKLHAGQEIAVKRLSKNSRQGLTEFRNEVILIAKLQHRNLVGLLGCCIQNEEQILIYEYLPNGSLDSYIFDPERGHLLDWQKRFDIILGIVRGLVYLPRDSRLRIIHWDRKASNILLDGNLNPKISDFGIAKTIQGELAGGVTRRVIGTYFGVLVLEIINGKRNRGFRLPHHNLSLLGHASIPVWNLFNERKALELLDPSIRSLSTMSEVSRCIQIGLLCVQCHAKDRPTMSSALWMLDSENALLSQPKESGFYSERSITELSTYEAPITGNELTITFSGGR